jgi:uncharacterized protein (UPF0216 family)
MSDIERLLIDKVLEEQERIVGKLVLMLPKKDLKKINKMIRAYLESLKDAKIHQEDNPPDGV